MQNRRYGNQNKKGSNGDRSASLEKTLRVSESKRRGHGLGFIYNAEKTEVDKFKTLAKVACQSWGSKGKIKSYDILEHTIHVQGELPKEVYQVNGLKEGGTVQFQNLCEELYVEKPNVERDFHCSSLHVANALGCLIRDTFSFRQ